MTTIIKTPNIKCPDCGSKIDVNQILVKQITSSIKEKYNNKETELNKKELEFEKKKSKANDIIASKLVELKKEQRKEVYNEVRANLSKENKLKFNLLNEELEKKSKQIQRFRGLEAELEKTRREAQESQAAMLSKLTMDHVAQLKVEKAKAYEEAEKRHEMKRLELEKMLKDQKILTEEQKRKLEQGSMELQGEVQEKAIEKWLKDSFPLDLIEEEKKGSKGADCLQVVNTRDSVNCGSIYYESKRTKGFLNKWITKFKKDMQRKNADIGVLVTKTFPKDIKRMSFRDGIYICDFNEFKGLSHVLRNVIIEYNKIKISQENKGDKKEMLYDYLTSIEFRTNIQNFLDAFNYVNSNLEKEKEQVITNFEKRKGAYDLMKSNVISMFGRFTGIAGSKIESIESSNKQENLETSDIDLLKSLSEMDS